MGSVSISIVEGNPHLRSLLGWHLQQVGHWVHQSADINHAREIFFSQQPSLVILDAELPDGDGLEFCRWLQQQQQSRYPHRERCLVPLHLHASGTITSSFTTFSSSPSFSSSRLWGTKPHRLAENIEGVLYVNDRVSKRFTTIFTVVHWQNLYE